MIANLGFIIYLFRNPPPQQLQNSTCQPSTSRKNATYKLTMLGWSGDDTRLITIGSDFLVRVWDWKSGQMLRKMEGHTNEVFVIKTHPVHNDLIFTAGHDGLLMVSLLLFKFRMFRVFCK